MHLYKRSPILIFPKGEGLIKCLDSNRYNLSICYFFTVFRKLTLISPPLRGGWVGLFILLSLFGFAQKEIADTTHQLDEVVVEANRIVNFTSGNKVEQIDRKAVNRHLNNSLADLMVDEGQLFVKSYGLGSLATTSFRGAGGSHTAILWNGFNLQSPMNGFIDLALIPGSFLDNVKIQHGGSSALWGSGAVGGVIHLNNVPQFDKGISVSLNGSLGSFGNQQENVGFQISRKKFISSTKIFHQQAHNNFPFINIAQYGKPEQIQTNAELKEYGLLQENYLKINDKQKISARFWYQFNDRNIPPAMTQNISVSRQKDEFYRSTAEWERRGYKTSFFIRAAYFDEMLNYADSLINLDETSHSKSLITESECKIHVTNQQLINIGINNTYSQATSPNYPNIPDQNRFAVFGSYKIHDKKDNWKSLINIREELIHSSANPITVSAGFEGSPIKTIFLKGNVSKNYRVPTFNDLYWVPGGNTNLKPESGWSEEMGLIHKKSYSNLKIEAGATLFNSNISNWIIWLPDNYGLWSPGNILSVWSRGAEYEVKVLLKINKLEVALSGNYNYVLSTNQEAATANDPSLDKQLIYVPVNKAQGKFSVFYKGFELTYIHHYVGYRYTTADNTAFLNPYATGNLSLNKLLELASFKIKIDARVDNIWNAPYQVLAYRAMPLRNYQVGFSLNINKPNK